MKMIGLVLLTTCKTMTIFSYIGLLKGIVKRNLSYLSLYNNLHLTSINAVFSLTIFSNPLLADTNVAMTS